MSNFLPDRPYDAWQSEEANPHRVPDLAPTDPDVPPNATVNQRAALLTKRRRQCQIFLSQVAKCVSETHDITTMDL